MNLDPLDSPFSHWSTTENKNFFDSLLPAFDKPCRICRIAEETTTQTNASTHNSIECKNLKLCASQSVTGCTNSLGFPNHQQAGLPSYVELIAIRRLDAPRTVKYRLKIEKACVITCPWELPLEDRIESHKDHLRQKARDLAQAAAPPHYPSSYTNQRKS